MLYAFILHSFFKRRYSIILEFLPQVVFLCLLFAYMVFMMFYKWVAYSCFSEGMRMLMSNVFIYCNPVNAA